MYEPNFFDALNNFANSVKSLNYSSAIEDANQRTQDIKASLMPDMQKRQTLSTLADNMFMHLTAAGAPPEMAAAVHHNIMPQTPSSAEQAILQGQLTGDKSLMEAGKQVLDQQDTAKIRLYKAQSDISEKSDVRKFGQQTKMEIMKETAAEKRQQLALQLKPADSTQLRKAADVTKMMKANDDYETAIKHYDPTNTWNSVWNKYTPNAMNETGYQQVKAAQEQWAIARLGEEYTRAPNPALLQSTIETYFPGGGAGPETVRNKARMREALHQTGAAEAGPRALQTLAVTYPKLNNVFNEQLSNVKDPNFKLQPLKAAIKE